VFKLIKTNVADTISVICCYCAASPSELAWALCATRELNQYPPLRMIKILRSWRIPHL